METIINLTKGQKDTLNALEKGDYSKLRMANITRLLKKTINNEELSKKIIPRVVDYQRKVQVLPYYLPTNPQNNHHKNRIFPFFSSRQQQQSIYYPLYSVVV